MWLMLSFILSKSGKAEMDHYISLYSILQSQDNSQTQKQKLVPIKHKI